MEEDIKYWIELADYDLETAKAMLKTGRYVYVLFMCQQVLEKALKAHVVQTTKTLPPRLHNLIRLLELSGLEIGDGDKTFLDKLSYYYLETRYPDQKKKIAKETGRKLAEDYYNKTGVIYKWLKTKLS